jgi:hypothetical protein
MLNFLMEHAGEMTLLFGDPTGLRTTAASNFQVDLTGWGISKLVKKLPSRQGRERRRIAPMRLLDLWDVALKFYGCK